MSAKHIRYQLTDKICFRVPMMMIFNICNPKCVSSLASASRTLSKRTRPESRSNINKKEKKER